MPSAQLLAAAPLVEPRWYSSAAYDYTLGPEVAELLAGCRDDKGPYLMDPEQQLLLDDWFGYRVDLGGDRDRLAHFEGAVVAARQDMKTGALKAAALGKIYLCEQRLVVWTAHRLIAVAEAYRDIKQLIESNPDMAAELVAHHDSPGKEELEFTGGRRIIFRVRTADNVQSLAGDTVILDEGFAVKVEHLLALLPILSARPEPQVLWGSSAGVLASVSLRAVRKRGRVGDARLCYAEWAAERRPCSTEWCVHAPGTPGCAMDDRELWLQANVAITRGRKTLEGVEDMRKAFSASPEIFASQFLVWWEDPPDEGEMPINPQKWADLLDLDADLGDLPTFALDVSPKATMACILAVGAQADGIPVVSITGRAASGLDYRPGIGWVVPRLVELDERWPGFRIGILAGSSAEALVPAIEQAGVAVDLLPAAEYPQACVWMKSQVDGSKPGVPLLRHIGQDELSRSLAMLRPRDSAVRGTFTWGRATSADICPGVAMTVALWQAQQAAGASTYESNRLEVV